MMPTDNPLEQSLEEMKAMVDKATERIVDHFKHLSEPSTTVL